MRRAFRERVFKSRLVQNHYPSSASERMLIMNCRIFRLNHVSIQEGTDSLGQSGNLSLSDIYKAMSLESVGG